MSNALAIAAVTWVLKDLLNEGLINSNLAAQVKVTALPPIRDPIDPADDQSQLNLFLYHITPNPGWRNTDLPVFDSSGARVGNPPLALDLHYLLTAYDAHDLHAEVLLGYALQLMHQMPVLTRQAIRASLRNLPDSTLPPRLQELTRSGLADQVEAIKITPQVFSTDEMSKLWTGFQAPYRPSVAYLVTTVLIESSKPVRSALPVLRVGSEARGPVAQASLLPPYPTLLALRTPTDQITVVISETILLFGHHLEATEVEAVLRNPALDLEVTLPAETRPFGADERAEFGETLTLPDDVLQLASTYLLVNLAPAGANLAPGFYSIEVRLRNPTNATVLSSNALPLALAPEIQTTNFTRDFLTFQVPVRPKIRPGQRVALFVGDQELSFHAFLPDLPDTSVLEFTGRLPVDMFGATSPGVPRRQFIRLRVDGVESRLVLRSRPPAPPQFNPDHAITMPPAPPSA